MKKPDGLTIIHPDQVSQIIDPLPIKDLCGIGSRMEKNLNLLGIRTIGDLGRFPVDILKRKFGINGLHLHDMGLGIDNSPVVPASDQDKVKSVGHSMTLRQDVSRRQDILKYLLQLSEMVGRRARRYGVSSKTVHLYVRYADFYSSWGKQQTLAGPVNQSDDIYKAAIDILDTVELQQPVRLLGIRLTNLRYQDQVSQLPLFPQERRKALMVRAMDAVNNRYGDEIDTFASLMDTEEKGSHVISPAWRQDGIRCVDIK
jgi:DNA polymerase IV